MDKCEPDPELCEAARANDVAGVRQCLVNGEYVDERGLYSHSTPLMDATRHEDPAVMLLLLHQGADMKACDNRGRTALHSAAWWGSANCARVLTALGADVNARTSDGKTPVMMAALFDGGDFDPGDVAATARVLLEAGADISLRDNSGNTALDLAEGRGQRELGPIIKDPTILQWGNKKMTDDEMKDRLQSLSPGDTYRVLLLNDNCLTRVPDLTKYPQLAALEVVNMANNRLIEVEEEHLPASVKTVYLGHNDINTLSPQLESEWLHSYFEVISNSVQAESRHIRLHPNSLIVRAIKRKVEAGNFDIYGSFYDIQTPVDTLPDLSQMLKVKEVFIPYQDISFIDVALFSADVKKINLNHNLIQSLPNMNQMNSLRTMSFSNNEIVEVLGLPIWLQSIDLQGNPIRTLHRDCFPSKNVYKLLSKALTEDQIDELHQPPPEIFRRGYEAVIQYYGQADISELTDKYSNRMTIVGEALAGKTSLIQTLIHGEPYLTGVEDRTEVVQTHTWRLPDGCTYQVFDQGGHSIYGITNRLFLSKDSKNLICHNIKDGSIKVATEMLENILHQFPNGYIHFGLTKLDLITDEVVLNEKVDNFKLKISNTFKQQIALLKCQTKAEIDVKMIKSYENRKKDVRFFPVSSQNIQGMSEVASFFHDIAKENKKVVPKNWLYCLESIQKDKKPFLKLSEFKEYYDKYDLSSTTEASYLTSLRYFSDCGQVIWYEEHESLKQFVFHNIQYLISLMKCVFRHDLEEHMSYETNADLQKEFNQTDFKQVITEFQTQGLLSLKLLTYLWKDEFGEVQNKDDILDLMKCLDICQEVCDKNNDDENEKKYFFPWFVTDKEEPTIIRDMYDTDCSHIILHLQCIFRPDIPVNVTELLMVHLQRLASEEGYLNEREAWRDGLYVSDGEMKATVLRVAKTRSLEIYVKDEIAEIFSAWKVFLKLKESLLEILSHWHGIVEDRYIPCFHCKYLKKSEIFLWPLQKVFGTGREKVYTSCGGDNKVPAILVTMINTGDDAGKQTKHIQAVEDFLSSNKQESSGAATTLSLNVPYSSQPGTLHLQNQERELDETLRVKGTFVLRQLLQKQVLDTWGHELELLLQDTSAGVIHKSGPNRDTINKFQVLVYKNKHLSLFEEESQKLKAIDISKFDISLMLKLLRVPKISGIDVTKKRWDDFQKGSIEDMLQPKKPGPPGRQEVDESTHTKLAGWASVIVNLRNNIHNKTDDMNLNKDQLETSMSYLSDALGELSKYLGITEKDMPKREPTELYCKEPYKKAVNYLSALTECLQQMSGNGAAGSGNSSPVHSHPQP